MGFKRLFTKEDNYNIHKFLGVFCLSHYIYRFTNLFVYGDMFFDDSMLTYVTPFIHLTLSLSSFIFHIPKKKISQTRPIIYRELQLHNIVFTLRSCIVFFLGYYGSSVNILPLRFVLIMYCHILADYISFKEILNEEI